MLTKNDIINVVGGDHHAWLQQNPTSFFLNGGRSGPRSDKHFRTTVVLTCRASFLGEGVRQLHGSEHQQGADPQPHGRTTNELSRCLATAPKKAIRVHEYEKYWKIFPDLQGSWHPRWLFGISSPSTACLFFTSSFIRRFFGRLPPLQLRWVGRFQRLAGKYQKQISATRHRSQDGLQCTYNNSFEMAENW